MKQILRGWAVGLLLACSATRPEPVTTAARAEATAPREADAGGVDAGGVAEVTPALPVGAPPAADMARVEVDVQGEAVACALQPTADGVTAACPRGALRCAVLARGDVTPDPGEEMVSRCEDGARAFVVVSTAGAVRWSARLDTDDESVSCAAAPRVEAEMVRVLDEGPRALLVRARDCGESGLRLDWDALWLWGDGAMRPVARASFRCESRGATAGPRASVAGAYGCAGGYLSPEGAGRAEALPVRGCAECVQRRLGTARLLAGRGEVTQTQRWDAAARRFVAP